VTRRARKLCSHHDCAEAQPCPEHAPKPWAGSTRRQRLPPDWDRRRRTVIDRDPICRICANALSAEVDHIAPGDNHDLENLQGLCKPCHRDKTQAEAAAARAANQQHT
jgi:5-methylcytosine-specific restriction endonuclease McrA